MSAPLLWMNRRKEKLEHAMILVRCTSRFSLWPAHNPIAALFRFRERIDASGYFGNKVIAENDFYASLRAPLAAMDDGCSQFLMKDEIPFI